MLTVHRHDELVVVAFSSLARILRRMFDHSFAAYVFFFFFFEVEISSLTLISLSMSGSVHSGSAT